MNRSWLLLTVAAPLVPGAVLLLHVTGWIPSKGVLIIVLAAVTIAEAVAILSLALAGHPGRRGPCATSAAEVLYSDNLIAIDKDQIIFHHYGLFSSRAVPLAEIHAIRALPPTLGNGKWRLGGTGDFQTWFPSDMLRFRRDTIFVAEMKKSGEYRIGFTAKDSRRVRAVLQDLGLLHPICSHCGYDLRASKESCPECGTPA